MEIEKNRETQNITMSQMSCIEKILKHFIIKKCKPVGSPFDVNLKLLKLSNKNLRTYKSN